VTTLYPFVLREKLWLRKKKIRTFIFSLFKISVRGTFCEINANNSFGAIFLKWQAVLMRTVKTSDMLFRMSFYIEQRKKIIFIAVFSLIRIFSGVIRSGQDVWTPPFVTYPQIFQKFTVHLIRITHTGGGYVVYAMWLGYHLSLLRYKISHTKNAFSVIFVLSATCNTIFVRLRWLL